MWLLYKKHWSEKLADGRIKIKRFEDQLFTVTCCFLDWRTSVGESLRICGISRRNWKCVFLALVGLDFAETQSSGSERRWRNL